jgi:hypothetical protein
LVHIPAALQLWGTFAEVGLHRGALPGAHSPVQPALAEHKKAQVCFAGVEHAPPAQVPAA